jgi:uncharacterized protein (UPF0332 family)
MSETLYPKINPKQYFDLATSLSESTDSLSLRSSVDRAYYAAFLHARNTLYEKGWATPHKTSDDHKYITEKLKDPNLLGTFGNEAVRLRRTRNLVTYTTGDITRDLNEARPISWVLHVSKSLIDKISEVKKKPPAA